MLNGKKTYIVAVGIVLVAAGSFLQGDITLAEAINNALYGLGFAAIRIGLPKEY